MHDACNLKYRQRTSAIQLQVLEMVHKENPCGRWAFKADGCDIHKWLRESVKHKWSGDVDLVDGKLQRLYSSYIARRKFVECFGLGCRRDNLLEELRSLKKMLEEDKIFFKNGEKTNSESYNKRLDQTNVSEDVVGSWLGS